MKTKVAMLAGMLNLCTPALASAQAADAGVDSGPDGGVCLAGPAIAHEDARRIDHLARARDLEQSGDLVGAIAEARRAAYDLPGREPLDALARLAQRAKDPTLLSQALGALADAAPADPEPLVRLARLFADGGEPGKAADAAAEAVERDPQNAEAWHLVGRAAMQRQALADAVTAFERTVRLNPRHAWAWNNLGYARLLAGKPEKAVFALEHARELAPHLAYVRNNLGVAYERLGRLDEAQFEYGKALDLEPAHPSAAANFARAAEALGWAGPSVESTPDGGVGERTAEWSGEEFAPGPAPERSWLFESTVKGAEDEPTGADLRDPPESGRPLGVAAGLERTN